MLFQIQFLIIGVLVVIGLALLSFIVGLVLTKKLLQKKEWDDSWWIPFNLNAMFFILRLVLVFIVPGYIPMLSFYIAGVIPFPLILAFIVNLILGTIIILKTYRATFKESFLFILLILSIILIIDILVSLFLGIILVLILLSSTIKT